MNEKIFNIDHTLDTASLTIEDGYLLLAERIVEQAIWDWRSLVNGQYVPQTSFKSLEAFFKSEWCGFLMHNLKVTPSEVLKILQKEREEGHCDLCRYNFPSI